MVARNHHISDTMSGLLCCVSETGPFKDEQLTLKRLPKATDDCAVVPCLFDDEDGRMQFARDFPWQLQGIMTQHGARRTQFRLGIVCS